MFVAISVCEPTVLSGNKFLDDFVNHEYINVLAVIVTVSLVSVVQIHLEYSRVERRFKTRIFGDARRTVNAGALWLTGLLIGSFVLSFFRASFIDNPVFVSMIHGAALLTVLTAIYIMYDFVRVVFALASEEPLEGDDANP
jgi:cobalamin biosynthesis protein CobD/CbiB